MRNSIIRLVLILFFFSLVNVSSHADEGMWLPQLLQQMNAPEMRLKGLQIPIEEIYSTNKNTLKDAVVLFNGNCTAALISNQGLLLTNHHCGYSQIQSHTTLAHNYIHDGFWAKTLQDELPCPGLTVTFIISIKDVTAEFNRILNDSMTEAERNEKIKVLASQLEKAAIEGTKYEAKVKQFFSGNEFYLITTETYKDIRMVGAPPASIARFGGDTDNWMWPSHACDFSMFRIYVNKENAPSEYSIENVPYKPKKFFTINLNGVQQEDFTMVYGFPGTTREYISSYATAAIVNVINPDRIKVRLERLRIIDAGMRSSELIHIQYAAKQSTISNGWKKWKGESRGLIQANTILHKQEYEKDFQAWANADSVRKIKYGALMPSFEKIYSQNKPYIIANDFYAEAVFGIEAINYAAGFHNLVELGSAEKPDLEKIKTEAEKLLKGVTAYFKNYDAGTDQQITASLLKMFDDNVSDSLKPGYFIELRTKYQNNYVKLATDLFKYSDFVSAEKMNELMKNFTLKKIKVIEKDPFYKLADQLWVFNKNRVADKITTMNASLIKLNRLYMEGQRKFQPEKKFYPDANLTLRLAYGQVRGYSPRDAVYYQLNTTLDGVIEKYIPDDEEFDLPPRLIELYNKKDYGPYEVNGTVPVAFIATNHTTGGNSGSPVMNAKGQLTGINYDRVWEGTMSDIQFNPEVCRNISLDLRYALFIVDKYAEAQRLMEEMDIIYPH